MCMEISLDQARQRMVSWHQLCEPTQGPEKVRSILHQLRCIQLDPLDRIGTNADLVVFARADGLKRGDVHRQLQPGAAFEHFAKERCLLPSSAFPYYRDQAVETPWWRLTERLTKISEQLLADVLAEIGERGALRADQLTPRGKVEAMDWAGWKGTSKASTMALEVLWTRCQVVTAKREGNTRWYDLPSRTLSTWDHPTEDTFQRWALRERALATGLLTPNAGPQWSMLSKVRTSPLPAQMVKAGDLVQVTLPGVKKSYFAAPQWFEHTVAEPDDRMRVLGPLDPLLWDRDLVKQLFHFDYVWEVYKPEAQRKWGWYVCPLLHRGHLVGRLEAHREDGKIKIDRLWKEAEDFDSRALDEAIDRLSATL